MKSPLLEDKFMRVLLLFDLPTRTKQDQKRAAKFRSALVKLGFFMMQFSVYMRICKGHSAARAAVARVRGVLPPQGNVRSLIITEKQFDNMEILLGSAGFNERANGAENIVLFDFDEKAGDFVYLSGGEMKSGEFIALGLDGGGNGGEGENCGGGAPNSNLTGQNARTAGDFNATLWADDWGETGETGETGKPAQTSDPANTNGASGTDNTDGAKSADKTRETSGENRTATAPNSNLTRRGGKTPTDPDGAAGDFDDLGDLGEPAQASDPANTNATNGAKNLDGAKGDFNDPDGADDDETARFFEICARVSDRARKAPRSRRKTIQELVEKTLFEF